MALNVLVGVDGGGSGVRAARVVRTADGAFALDSDVLVAACTDQGDEPSAVNWIEAAAAFVAELAGSAPVLFGMGMPGRKTPNGRGIERANFGPVDERFLDRLEAEIEGRGVALAAHCTHLDDDGLLGCTGELLATAGALRGATSAYFVGGGTGLSEAFVLGGEAVSFEDGAPNEARAWALDDKGRSFEQRLSVRGLNASYLDAGGTERFIELGLQQDEPIARAVLLERVRALERLVRQREEALGVRFERVLVSQRLASVLGGAKARALIAESVAPELRATLAFSTEPASAVIGAAALAARRA